MDKPQTNCLGIDLTQHLPMLAIAKGCKIVDCKPLANTPPVVLLPILPKESVMAGAAAHEHRRGTGIAWPPECQVPIHNDFQNGVGRIPLVCAWYKLAKHSTNSFLGKLDDTWIGWRPKGKRELSFSSEELIAKSIISWERKYFSRKTAVVVPDSLEEAAQQALVENCDAFLVPRPVAVAVSWCRNNAEKFQGIGEKSEEGVTIGHLVVITMAFDQWEIVPIEVRAKIFGKELWLTPVRNRVAGGGEFPRIGVSFFLGLAGAGAMSNNLEDIWQLVFSSVRLTDCVNRNIIVNKEKNKALMRECIINGWTTQDQRNLQRLDPWTDMIQAFKKEIAADLFKDELLGILNRQLQALPDMAQKKCLGIIIDGACTQIPITDTRLLGDFIADTFYRFSDK